MVYREGLGILHFPSRMGRPEILKPSYFFLGAWLINNFEDTGANLCPNIGQYPISFKGLNDQIFEFVELLHKFVKFENYKLQMEIIFTSKKKERT